jgi:pilus assembly protein CpaB
MAKIQTIGLARGNRALWLVGVGAAFVAAVLVFVALNNDGEGGGESAAVADTQEVLVATQSVAAGTEITEEMVELRAVPTDLVLSGSYSESELVVGEVAKVTLAEGEQLTTQKIGLPVPDGLTGVVPRGMRGVSMEVKEVTAVGGLLLPGDRVDIVATYRVDRAGLPENAYILRTETILQNVEVLSVAQEAQEPTAQESDDAAEEDADVSYTSGDLPEDLEEQPDAGTLTVALSLAEAQTLILKQEHAQRVWAVLRAYGDDTPAEVPPSEIIITNNEGLSG